MGLLTMLTNIEIKLEELLQTSRRMPKEVVDASERNREKARRQKHRMGKQEQQKKNHEARMARAMERANAPVFKRTGKPEMFRSVLSQRKKERQKQTSDDDDQELLDFLSQDF